MTTPFLEQQKRVMAQKEQLERDQEQKQRYTVQPSVSGNEKPYDPKAKYEIVTFDANTGETTHRTITPLPTPQRLQQSKTLSKPEIVDMIDSLRDEMALEQEKFDRKDEIDGAAAMKRGKLIAKVNELTAQLNAAKSELDQLNREGSVRDGWIAFAKQAELRITQIATATYGHLLERFSHEQHEAPFAELTELLKEAIRFKVDRSGIRTFTQPNFARLYAAPKESITNARIEATLEKVFAATEKLETVLDK